MAQLGLVHALIAVFKRFLNIHTEAIFTGDEPNEYANSLPNIDGS